MIEYGVYISNDIEAVITEKFVMTFRRVRSQDAQESCLLERDEPDSQYTCVGICRSLPATTIAFPKPRKWEYAFKCARKTHSNSKRLKAWIGKAYPNIRQYTDRLEISFPDGDAYSADKTEAFCMSDIHPEPPSINESNIDQCLQRWHMGCSKEIIKSNGNDSGISVSINTQRHMYIFQMLPNDFYCRAARYSTCKLGVVFNQNFRQRSGDLSETYMVDDNRIACDPLKVDESAFSVCQVINYGALMQQNLTEREINVFCYRYGLNGFEKKTQAEISRLLGISRSYVSKIHSKALRTVASVIPKPTDNNIYWAVSSYTDNQIILNGCQGGVYEWNKPELSKRSSGDVK